MHAGVILCGDIGGTKTHLALFAPDRPTEPIGLVTYASRSARDLGDLVAQHDLPARVDAACFAVAGPVIGERVETTNLPWVVEAPRLSAQLGGAAVFLLNDLQGLAHGVGLMTPAQLAELNPAATVRPGNVAVIAAGSGLGEAGLVADGRLFHAFASEGGHTDFGPRTDVEVALLRHLSERFGHVSYERVVSGPGLVNVFDFFRDVQGLAVPAELDAAMASGDPAAAIASAALADGAPVAVAALDLFARVYGAEAGNLALKLMAVGGVYVGGGIAPKILAKLRDGAFLEAFVDKGRFRGVLEAIPVRIVLEPRAGLYGAAGYAAARLAGGV